MRIRWMGFELPNQLHVESKSKTETYGKFTIEPFECGYGITIGNSLRRVLLSSLQGSAPVSLRIKGASHEFASIPGIYEDVINIALNVKNLLLAYEGTDPVTVRIEKSGVGAVTGADVVKQAGVQVINPDCHIATIQQAKVSFEAEIEFRKGRGYVAAEEGSEVGVIPLDAAYSPVRRARWRVEDTRVGEMTNYERLILEIWTDGTISPEDAMVEAATILRKHLNPIIKFKEIGPELEHDMPLDSEPEVVETLDKGLLEKLEQPVSVLDPSVRAANCLSAEGIKTIRDLVTRAEQDMLQVRNFGKTSLKEIKIKLAEMGLKFGMTL